MTYSTEFLDKYRNFNVDYDWWEAVYEDFERVCEILGIHIETTGGTMLDTRPTKPCIFFSGFSSQGDGASWEGSYTPVNLKKEHTYDRAPAAIRAYASLDEELHRIADALCLLARVYFPTYARVATNSRYSHAGSMTLDHVEVYAEGQYQDSEFIGDEVVRHIEDELTTLMRDTANWLYRSLEKEYEYLTSDETIIESLEANEIFEEDK